MRESKWPLMLLMSIIVMTRIAESAEKLPSSDSPLKELPYNPGIDPHSIDQSTDPCVDFYQYSCGGWIKNNPMPADQARWTVTGKLINDTMRYLWGILDHLSTEKKNLTPNQEKLGQFYSSCMDEEMIEKKGGKPLADEWKIIAGMKSKADFPATMAQLKQASNSDSLFFGFRSIQDLDSSSDVIAAVDSGGLGLPDRSFYTKKDAPSREIQKQYKSHIIRMLVLMGSSQQSAAKDARAILSIETALATAMLARTDQRNVENLAHKFDVQGMQGLTP